MRLRSIAIVLMFSVVGYRRLLHRFSGMAPAQPPADPIQR